MTNIMTDVRREIIQDFAKAIKSRTKRNIKKPSKAVIEFRDERKENHEREIVQVPVEILLFRKGNGRIASDVLSYEKNNKPLVETEKEGQKLLKEFLNDKDPEITDDLCKSIKHSSQKEPAIITCDGFLINGNRRKLALEILHKEKPDTTYEWMNVVILPGEDDTETGGPPTIREIAQIESRYQSQVTGKAEYYSFDEALSTRRYIEDGISLEEKLRDDPRYVDMSDANFKKALKKYEEEYLNPLICVDEYLSYLGRDGIYTNISSGKSDREGRWEAFKDYYKRIKKNLGDENKRRSINVKDEEIGDIESIAYKLIRVRELPGIKLHESMRELPNWLKNNGAKKELFRILDVEDDIPENEKYYEDGVEIDDREKDRIWIERNKNKITGPVKNAMQLLQKTKEQETPIDLLHAALRKLEHDNLLPQNILVSDADEAMKILNKIETTTKELHAIFWEIKKGPKKLKEKFNK